MFRPPPVMVVFCDSGSTIGSALSDRLSGEGVEVRFSPVVDSWEGLSEVCAAAWTSVKRSCYHQQHVRCYYYYCCKYCTHFTKKVG